MVRMIVFQDEKCIKNTFETNSNRSKYRSQGHIFGTIDATFSAPGCIV